MILLLTFIITQAILLSHAHELKGHEYAVSQNRFFEEAGDFAPGNFMNCRFIPGKGVLLTGLYKDASTSGVFVSQPVTAPFPMTELLPSWNIDRPTSTGFAVYFKVSPNGAEWSDWLYLGRDGIYPRPEERNLDFPGGKVDVDYILFEKPHRFYSWKVVLYSENPDASPVLKLFSVCAGNVEGDEELYEKFGNKKIAPQGKEIRLETKGRYQLADDPTIPKRMRGAICCPVSVAIVLDYLHHDLPSKQVCDLCYDRDYRLWGNWPRAAQTLSLFGLKSYVTQVRSVVEMRTWLAKELPLIISIKAYKGDLVSPPYKEAPGHIMVVSGMDEEGNLYINDPYDKAGVRLWTKEEIEKVHIDRGGVTIIAEPRK